MEIILWLGGCISILLSLGAIVLLLRTQNRVSPLLKGVLSKSELNALYPKLETQQYLLLHEILPSWSPFVDGKLSGMTMLLCAAIQYGKSSASFHLLLAAGVCLWAFSATLFRITEQIASDGMKILWDTQQKQQEKSNKEESTLLQTIDLLSKRIVGIEKKQQASLESVQASQKVLQQLPSTVETALKDGLSQELRPAMREMIAQMAKTQESTKDFVHQATHGQIEGINSLIASVSQGVQKSVGSILQQTTNSFVESVRQQEHTLTRWGRSIEQVVSVVSGIEKTAQVLSSGAEQMARAAEPVEAASQMFSTAAENLQRTLPSFANVSESYLKAQTVLEQAHVSLQRGTDQYVEASVQLRAMVQDLKESQGMAIRRISEGVNEAVLEPMKLAGEQLTKVQKEQRASLEQWSRSADLMNSTFLGLEGTVAEISQCAVQLKAASEPNAKAAESFLQTVIKLEHSIQQLDQTTQSHIQSKKMLETSASILKDGMVGYQKASGMLERMVEKLNEAHAFTVGTLQKGVEETLLNAFSQATALFSNGIVQTQKNVEQALVAGATSIEQFSEKWAVVLEDARVLLQQSLRQSSDIFARTIEETGYKLESTMEQSSQKMEESLNKSSRSLSSSMLSARQQMVDTISAATERLDHSLRQSTEGMTASWISGGEAVSKSLEVSSSLLQDRLHKAGEQILLQFENICIELVSSAQAASDAMHTGATSVKSQLKDVGSDWKSAIETSASLLLTSAEESSKHFHGLGDGLQEKTQEAANVLVETFQKGSHSIADELRSAGNTLSQKTESAANRFEQSLQSVQMRLENGAIQHVSAWEKQQKDGVAHLESATKGLVAALDNSFKGSAQRFVQAAEASAAALDKQSQASMARLDQVGIGVVQSVEQSSGVLVRNIEQAGIGFTRAATEAAQILELSTGRSASQFDEHFVKSAQVLSQSYAQAGTTFTQVMKDGTNHFVGSLESSSSQVSKNLVDAGKSLSLHVNQSSQGLVSALNDSAENMTSTYAKAGQELLTVLAGSSQELTTAVGIASNKLTISTTEGAGKLENAFTGAEAELRMSLTTLTKQLQTSLEQSQQKVAGLLDKSAQDMKSISDNQSKHIEQWSSIVQDITPVLTDLNHSTSGLNDLVLRLQEAISPVAQAATSFQSASENIQSVFPNIEATAAGYQRFNIALSNASESLTSSAHNYQAAGNEMSTLLGDIKQSLVLQTKCNQVFAKTLTQVKESVDAFVPVSVGMQDAAGNVQVLSESTANAVSVIKDAAQMQDRSVVQIQQMSMSLITLFEAQLQQLTQVSENFVQLQSTLNSGIDAFSEQLPQSVDKTLVHFDAALGKGVNRLGSSIERMREAMDDLVEQLETMLEAKKKR